MPGTLLQRSMNAWGIDCSQPTRMPIFSAMPYPLLRRIGAARTALPRARQLGASRTVRRELHHACRRAVRASKKEFVDRSQRWRDHSRMKIVRAGFGVAFAAVLVAAIVGISVVACSGDNSSNCVADGGADGGAVCQPVKQGAAAGGW
jgi:hypothetical protein